MVFYNHKIATILTTLLDFTATELQIYCDVYAKFAGFFTNAYIITHGKYTKQSKK